MWNSKILLLAQEKEIYVHWSGGPAWTTLPMIKFLGLQKDECLIAMLQIDYARDIDYNKMKRIPIENFY